MEVVVTTGAIICTNSSQNVTTNKPNKTATTYNTNLNRINDDDDDKDENCRHTLSLHHRPPALQQSNSLGISPCLHCNSHMLSHSVCERLKPLHNTAERYVDTTFICRVCITYSFTIETTQTEF